MARTHRIYSGLLASILLLIILLSGGILVTTLFGTREAVETMSESVIDEAAAEVAVQLRAFFDPPAAVLAMHRRWAERGLLDLAQPDRLVEQLAPVLEELPQISSLLFADEDGREFMLLREQGRWRGRRTAPGDVRLYEWSDLAAAPTITRDESGYDPHTRPWYQAAVREPRGELRWTKPYLFRTTKQAGVTVSVACRQGGKTHVLAFDILLDDLSAYAQRISTAQRLVFVLTEEGRVVAYPEGLDQELLQTPDALGLPELSASARAVADRLAASPVRFDSDGEMWWGAQRSFPLSKDRELIIAVVTPESALVGDLTGLRISIILVTLVVLGLAVWRGLVLARQYSRPIESLVRGSDRIRKGDLDHAEPVETRVYEFRTLAHAQEKMRASLKTLMKMERDLQVARQIQQNTFPVKLPQPANFEIEAWSEPADETGGDTYDVLGVGRDASDGVTILERDPENVLALLADATGHGIGPALSVTQVRAMLRMGVRSGVQIEEIVHRMNDQLCADLDAGRFVTLWLGELHPKTNTLITLSAGQGPMMHYRAGDDAFDVLRPQAPPLGVLPDVAFAPAPPLVLAPGDLYAVFSDGVYEARDAGGEVYGEVRAQAVLRRHRKTPARAILAELRQDLERFTGGARAADDQTGILIKRV